jgi:hypothetical protein
MDIEEVPIGFNSVGCWSEACPLHLLRFCTARALVDCNGQIAAEGNGVASFIIYLYTVNAAQQTQ